MIGIIGAMEQEITPLAQMIQNPKYQSVAGVNFIEGELEGHFVVLLRSGVGKVQAAMATTLLLERYQPSKIINIGSAGGLIPGMNIGDVIISNETGHHDVDLSPIGLEIGQLPQLPKTFASDPALIEIVSHSLKTLNIPSKIGMIATGDSFIADPLRVEAIKNIFPNVMAVEMEAAAIAQVAHLYKVPFIVIRALSDLPDKAMPMSFVEYLDFAAKNSTAMVLNVLANLSTSH